MQVKKEFLNMAKNAKSKSNYEYIKRSVNRLVVDFFPTDSELWALLEEQPKKATYIKDLIRADLAARKAEEEK